MGVETENDDIAEITQRNAERGAQVIQIENGKMLWPLIVVAALASIALGISIHSKYIAEQAAMEARLQAQHYMLLEAEIKARK